MEIWVSSVAACAAVFSVFFALRANGKSNTANREAAKANEIAQAALEHQTRYVPPWSIEWVTGNAYRLVNRGFDTEFDVQLTLDGQEGAQFDTLIKGAQDAVQPNASLLFYPSFGWDSGRGITVTWSRSPGGDSLVWKSMVPPRKD